jgi:DNA modification methylase
MLSIIAYCGLDCAKCDIFKATQAEDLVRKKQIAERWTREHNIEFTTQDIECDGCQSQRISGWCRKICLIRPCADKRGVKTCAHCSDYQCEKLEKFLLDEPVARNTLGEIRKSIHKLA